MQIKTNPQPFLLPKVPESHLTEKTGNGDRECEAPVTNFAPMPNFLKRIL
jgi:hypothetical protein